MSSVIADTLVARDPEIVSYLRVITDLVEDTPNKGDLSADDKERILIAVLAVRGLSYFLALHIYLALVVEGKPPSGPLDPPEILQVVRLAGIYGGLPVYSQALMVLFKTLEVLNDAAAGGKPPPTAIVINDLLRTAFPH